MLSPLRNRAGRRLREPFDKAGLTVAVIALVFAMLGGAYAAGKLTAKQKKEVEKIAKKFQGTGPAGAQGPAGANGSNGKDGAQGTTGPQGPQGPQGPKGEKGAKGDPGAAGVIHPGETLPSGASETGTWAVDGPTYGLGEISFTIPLAAPLGAEEVHAVPKNVQEDKIGSGSGEACEGKSGTELEECEEEFEELQEACPGNAEDPLAAKGQLCVYDGKKLAGGVINAIAPPSSESPGAGVSGAVVVYIGPSQTLAWGSWAVTAP